MTIDEQAKILVVEDELKLAELVSDYLKREGYTVSIANDGKAALEWVERYHPDLLILDIMIPGMSGVEVCQAVRATSEVPIIMLTARIDEQDRLLGFEVGADDYVCKPFSPRELVARVKTLLKRATPIPHSDQRQKGSYQLLSDRLSIVTKDKHEVYFTKVEFKILSLLLSGQGRVFSRQELMNACYDDYRVVNDRTIDSHIKKIRKKLDTVNGLGVELQSVYGVGYKCEAIDD